MLGWHGPLTHRQHLAWQDWLDDAWNRPDRGDHYSMALALQIERIYQGLAGSRRSLKLADFKLEFQTTQPAPKLTPQQEANVAKQVWLARLGMTGGEAQ